ncbi:MAG: hypothetical protein PHU25_08005 [Deltaproteobacteria bacterium]|nr:hypothetical protein [Deltaproteobacteria bacterium]
MDKIGKKQDEQITKIQIYVKKRHRLFCVSIVVSYAMICGIMAMGIREHYRGYIQTGAGYSKENFYGVLEMKVNADEQYSGVLIIARDHLMMICWKIAIIVLSGVTMVIAYIVRTMSIMEFSKYMRKIADESGKEGSSGSRRGDMRGLG